MSILTTPRSLVVALLLFSPLGAGTALSAAPGGADATRPASEPGAAPARAELPADAAAYHRDPDSYVVPERLRDSARALVEPGESGLPGGLQLTEVQLGNRVSATYAGDAGELKVAVVAPAVAGDDAAWVGRRLALVVVSSTLEPAARDRALARVRELLEGREMGWSWLRRPPGQAKRDEADQAAAAALKGARRLAWLGDAVAAEAAVQRALADAHDPLALRLEAARILRHAGALEAAAASARQAFSLATQALAADATTLDGPGKDRLRIASAMAMALEGEGAKAEEMTRELLRRGALVCEVARVAEELDRAGAFVEAGVVAKAVVAADPTCDLGWAVGIDSARHRGELEQAVQLGNRAVAERPVVVLARAALARASMAAGATEQALLPARVAVVRSAAVEPVLTTLAATAAQGVATAEVLEDWSGQAARYPKDAGRVALGALACWFSNDAGCAAERFARVRELNGGDAPGARALEALMLVDAGRLEDAAEAESAAWNEARVDLANVAAAARLSAARGDDAAAIAAWRAYIHGLEFEPGPVPAGTAKAALAALTGEGEAQAGAAAVPTPDVPASAPASPPLWPWLLGGALLLSGAWWWAGRGAARS